MKAEYSLMWRTWINATAAFLYFSYSVNKEGNACLPDYIVTVGLMLTVHLFKSKMIPGWLIIWYIPLFIQAWEKVYQPVWSIYPLYIVLYHASPSVKFYYKAESLKNILPHTPSWSRLDMLQSTVLHIETKLWYTYPAIVPSNQLAGCNHHDAMPPPVTSSNGFTSSKLCTKDQALKVKSKNHQQTVSTNKNINSLKSP